MDVIATINDIIDAILRPDVPDFDNDDSVLDCDWDSCFTFGKYFDVEDDDEDDDDDDDDEEDGEDDDDDDDILWYWKETWQLFECELLDDDDEEGCEDDDDDDDER